MIMTTITSLKLFSFLFFLSLANSLPIYKNPGTLCNYTPYPNFCKSYLPYDKPGTIQDYSKISISQSLSKSKEFLSLVQHYSQLPSTSYESTIRALDDCLFLVQQNIDSLSYALETLNNNNNLLSSSLTIDLLTLISATLTNQETCLECLQIVDSYSSSSSSSSSSILKGLSSSLSNGSKSYSTSLALYSHGWVPETTTMKDLTSIFGRRLLGYQTGSFLDNVQVNQMVVVNCNGTGDFPTITDAVNAAPNKTAAGHGYYVIYVLAGVYNEYVSIPSNKKYLMMIGDGINQTIITGNRSVDEGWTTFNSATFAVVAEGFVAMNITFQNTAGAAKHQAVAVRNGADLSAFYNCSFEGYQDTLYAHSLRQFYKNCDIYGTIDYIFGNAAVVLQDCNIYSRLPLPGQFNTVTAQGRTDINQNTGTSIQNCSIVAAVDLAMSNGTTKSYLGRPWKDYSRTVVMESFIDSLINPLGWAPWSGNQSITTLYYAEYDNYGPGSNTSGRVTWPGYHVINATDAVNFTVNNFIVGNFWLNTTGVPYYGDLIVG